LHSTAHEKVKYPLIRKIFRASTLPDLEVATRNASRSKVDINETKNLGMNIKPHLDLQRTGMRGINSDDIVLKTVGSYVIYHLRYTVMMMMIMTATPTTTTTT
jgi:hypothetical protein